MTTELKIIDIDKDIQRFYFYQYYPDWHIGFKSMCGLVFISKVSEDKAYWVKKESIIIDSIHDKVINIDCKRFIDYYLKEMKKIFKDNSMEFFNLEGYDSFEEILFSDKKLAKNYYTYPSYKIIFDGASKAEVLMTALLAIKRFNLKPESFYDY
jgi:hypothetical protein